MYLRNGLFHPLHIEVHHKALVARWERLKDSVNDRVIREINSQLSQAVVQPRHFEYVLTDRTIFLHLTTGELVKDFIYLDPGMILENHSQLFEHLICSVLLKTLLEPRF